MKPLHLIYDNGVLSCTIGRVIVAFYKEAGCLKVHHSVTGECLKDIPFTFTIDGFIWNVNHYNTLCNQNVYPTQPMYE